jgi:hypothetical protein
MTCWREEVNYYTCSANLLEKGGKLLNMFC